MNLFGGIQKKQKGPLAGMLQPNLMEMLQPEQEGLGSSMQRGWNQGASPVIPQKSAPPQETPGQAMQRGWFHGSDLPAPPTPDLPPIPGVPTNVGLDLSRAATKSSQGNEARDIMFGSKEGPMHEPPPEGHENRLSALDQYISDQFSGSPSAEGPKLSGGFDLAKLGEEAQSRLKQQDDFRQQFEGTPELDQLIAKAQGDLATAKSERKKPGLGEFLTLALMNLGNRDYRNNADMILGTGEQREKEQRLESLLTQLEGGRASAKMGGRRAMQAYQQKDKQSALERMMNTQEIMRKQKNEDRDYEFKKNQAGVNLLRQMAGQEGQIQTGSMDEKTRKAAADKRAKLMRALGIDQLDPGGMETLQQKQPPKDNRQSRLFGDFIGGGGYA